MQLLCGSSTSLSFTKVFLCQDTTITKIQPIMFLLNGQEMGFMQENYIRWSQTTQPLPWGSCRASCIFLLVYLYTLYITGTWYRAFQYHVLIVKAQRSLLPQYFPGTVCAYAAWSGFVLHNGRLETGKVTSEPIKIIAAGDPITCAIYAKDHGILDKTGWKMETVHVYWVWEYVHSC